MLSNDRICSWALFLEYQQHLRIMLILIGFFLVNFLSALNSIIIGEALLLGLEVRLELYVS